MNRKTLVVGVNALMAICGAWLAFRTPPAASEVAAYYKPLVLILWPTLNALAASVSVRIAHRFALALNYAIATINVISFLVMVLVSFGDYSVYLLIFVVIALVALTNALYFRSVLKSCDPTSGSPA